VTEFNNWLGEPLADIAHAQVGAAPAPCHAAAPGRTPRRCSWILDAVSLERRIENPVTPSQTLARWSVDPRVPGGGADGFGPAGPLFDALGPDTDPGVGVEKCV
jgi:hypothetical protein